MNNSAIRSGQTTANNSNRPSKTSNQDEKNSNDSMIFEKAAQLNVN